MALHYRKAMLSTTVNYLKQNKPDNIDIPYAATSWYA